MIRLRAKGKTDPLESHKNHRSRKARQCWEFSRKKGVRIVWRVWPSKKSFSSSREYVYLSFLGFLVVGVQGCNLFFGQSERIVVLGVRWHFCNNLPEIFLKEFAAGCISWSSVLKDTSRMRNGEFDQWWRSQEKPTKRGLESTSLLPLFNGLSQRRI